VAKSAIEWTDSTWNPVTGCTKISPGCKHCYAERMAKRLHAMGQPNWPANVWMGVSVEARDYLYRTDRLRNAGAQVKFISFEPLLEGLGKINLKGIHWAIVGGESGPRARPMDKEWVVEIKDQCLLEVSRSRSL